MLDAREACRVLGISDNAGRNEIERRYSILLKKYRMVSGQDEDGGADPEQQEEEFKRVTQAYNLLMGYEEPVEEIPQTPNPILKKIGVDEKKARNFFYYYKIHMLIGVLVIIVVVLTVRSFVTRVEPDFNTVFIGAIDYYETTEKLAAEIRTAVPDIKEPGFDGAFITGSGDGQQDYAMTMKAIAIFSSGSADLLIVDKVNFEKFAAQGGFLNLDDIAPSLGVDLAENSELRLKAEDDSEEHLYGVDVGDSPALVEAGVHGTEMIATIPANTKKQDTAVKLMEYLLEK